MVGRVGQDGDWLANPVLQPGDEISTTMSLSLLLKQL